MSQIICERITPYLNCMNICVTWCYIHYTIIVGNNVTNQGSPYDISMTVTHPYIHDTSITTSIISQHNSYDCMSTGIQSVAM